MAANDTELLTFRSSMFPFEPGEDEATNPGMFGRSLAAWLGRALTPGFTDDEVFPEDFGWLAPVPHPKCTLYVACQMTDESPSECLVTIIAEGGWKERLRFRDPRPEAARKLYERVKALLEREPGITDLKED